MKTCNIVFCSLPPSLVGDIPAAPALLRACVESYGYSARTLDLSMLLYQEYSDNSINLNNAFHPFIKLSTLSDQDKNIVNEYIDKCVEKIINLNPQYIGLSVFSSFTHKATYLICKKLKEKSPDIKIVVGGLGVDIPVRQVKSDLDITLSINDTFTPFYEYLINCKLADYYILGDGEEAIVELLDGNLLQDKNVRYTADIYQLPIPNYDDYIFAENAYLPVTGSKGCVRNCEFCDVRSQFGKFRRRNGKDVAHEMIALQKKYQISKFRMTDSLVNGSMSAFKEFVLTLAEHNQSSTTKIYWMGQYITRPQSQNDQLIYEKLRDSGLIGLVIGVESGSDDVLKSINKKVSINDVYDELKIFSKYQIPSIINIIPGYWSETWDNFLETIDFLKNIQPFVLDGSIVGISLGFPLMIYNRTKLLDNAEQYGIHMGSYANDASHIWWSEKNPRLTVKERYYRKLILDKLVFKLKYPIDDIAESRDWMVKYLATNVDKINEFYKPLLSNS
jgi:hypothetical protein